MIKEYRFKDIEKYLKRYEDDGHKILDAFSQLADAAIIFTPMVFGPQFAPFLALLDVKDRLVGLGKTVIDFIASKVEPDYIQRMEQIRAAYALICYTAYFEVLGDELPADVRKKLKLKHQKKLDLMKEVIDCPEHSQAKTLSPDIQNIVYSVDQVTSLSDIKEHLSKVYERVSDELIKLIAESSIYNDQKPKEKKQFEELAKSLRALPKKAIHVYEAQYLRLADQFEDFAYFAQMQNFSGIQRAVNHQTTALEKLSAMTDHIDVGLSNLKGLVNSIATDYDVIQAQDIVDDLKRIYNAIIEEPIIDDKEIKSSTERKALRFPTIVDAFIPQSYKCLSFRTRETRLEDESIWKKLPVQQDLHKFFIRYLYSLDSIEYPLIILGHPGSGKSLLTKVLSAQLMSDSYTVIRIPLREVDADADIDVLVEDQIKKLTNRSLSGQGYGGFAAQFKEKPLIIILDGYDELLQAKGDIFIGYLEKVRIFQQNQKAMDRPVRMIITSRITLIDKARVPDNATILRLMEFDGDQRQAWIDIWNNTNNEYFSESKVSPFQLPPVDERKGSLLELAEQPLLLLMLAIYDSEANDLARTSDIKRTELYDDLLRRFVRRERRRYVPGFEDKSEKDQEQIIDEEMKRLGVVAIGMYNRKGVVILSDQLEKDLVFFKAQRADGSPVPGSLRESESVLGGFFFIHKSDAKELAANSDASYSAFEFLHNTFGEFLAADFMLRYTMTEVKEMCLNRKFNMTALNNKLLNPDLFDEGWFACLMFVPLYSRPVIIEMLREHASKALQRCDFPMKQDDFTDNLRYIVQNQLKMILCTRNSPKVMRNGILSDRDIPLLGYFAIYSLNLVILASMLCPDGFEFDENEYNDNEYNNNEINELDSKPWDKLTCLWRTWFSPEDLVGLSVVLKASRESESKVCIKCNDKFEATRYDKPIDIQLSISSTLADEMLTGLTGLQSQRFLEITGMKDRDVKKMFKKENPDIYYLYLLMVLRREINEFAGKQTKKKGIREKYETINDLIGSLIEDGEVYRVNPDTLLCFFDMIESCFYRNLIFSTTRQKLIRYLTELIIDDSRIYARRIPKSMNGIRLLQLLMPDPYLFSYEERSINKERYLHHKLLNTILNEYEGNIMRNYSRHISNDLFSTKLIDYWNIYEASLFDVIEISPKQKMKKISPFFERDNLQVLIRTNPELLSRSILSLIRKDNTLILKDHIYSEPTEEMLDYFFEGCCEQLATLGMAFFGFNATLNAIKIAKIIGNGEFLRQVTAILQEHLFGRSELISYMIYRYPAFIAELMDMRPEIFSNGFISMSEPFFFEKVTRHMKIERLFDYLKIYRFISEDTEFNKQREKMHPHLRYLTKMISSSINISNIELEKLTFAQLSSLSWYADVAKNIDLQARIRNTVAGLH